jgi:hypothetical protein
MRWFFAIVLAVMWPISGPCHDFWSTGAPVPTWVKAQCCGQADAHQLRPSAVHIISGAYHIDGLRTVVPISRALPSQDGQYWGFWNPAGEPNPPIYCFFAPVNGS